jgi:hypothetical protein
MVTSFPAWEFLAWGPAPCPARRRLAQGAQLAFNLIAHAGRGSTASCLRSSGAAVAARVRPRPMAASRRTSASSLSKSRPASPPRPSPGHPAQRHGGPANDQAIRGIGGLGLGLDQLAQEDVHPREGTRRSAATARDRSKPSARTSDAMAIRAFSGAGASARSSAATGTSWVTKIGFDLAGRRPCPVPCPRPCPGGRRGSGLGGQG